MTNEERIKADAEAYAETNPNSLTKSISYQSYIAGATAENERAQVLVDALELIIKNGENIRSTYKVGKPAFYIKTAREALEQWKSGKEKEEKVYRPCPHCGKELFRDRNLCCRACGKEVGDG